MKKFIKAAWVIITLLLSASILCSCWDIRELNDLAIISGFGIDAAEDDQIKMLIQIGKAQQSGSEGGNEEPSKIFEDTDKSAVAALTNFRNKLSRTPFLQHSQIVLFGREQAEKDLASYIDGVLRLPDARMEMWLAVSDTTAKELFEADVKCEKTTADTLSKVIKNSKNISGALPVSVFNFLQSYKDPFTTPVLPLIKLDKKDKSTTFEYSSLAIIQGDKMTGELSGDTAKGFMWLSGSVKSRYLRIITEDKYANIQFSGTKISFKPIKDGDEYRIDMSVKADLSLNEIQGFKGEDVEKYEDMFLSQAELAVMNEIDTCFTYAKSLNADIFKYGRLFHKKSGKKTRKIIEKHWQEIFPQLKLNVKLNFTLGDTGNIKSGMKKEHANDYD